MKNITFLFCFLFFLNLFINPAFINAQEYFCTPKPYPISKSSTFMQNVLGSNFIVTKFIEREIRQYFLDSFSTDSLKVDIDIFNVKNAKEGKFKKLELKTSNFSSGDFFASSLKAKTLCGYNQINLNDETNFFLSNFLVEFNVVFNRTDLNNMVNTKTFNKELSKFTNSTFNLIDISDIHFDILNDKIVLMFDVNTNLFLKQIKHPVTIFAGLEIVNNKIKFQNIEVKTANYSVNSQSFINLINELNPFDINFNILQNVDYDVLFNSIKISDNKISVDGVVKIFKSQRSL